MSAKLKLANDLALPIEMAGQAVALVGIRGSGKTNTAGVIAEELLDHGQQIVVIDPTDAWWGIRSEYPVFIFGGPHGDLPLTEADGKTLAEFVVQEQVPIILSLRHLRKGAQRRLVTEFCEELYHLKGRPEYRAPLTVFMDEAPQFIPQRVLGEMARLVGAVQDMILLGRSAGFGVVMISQRFATLNADVRTQADTVIVHRLPSPLDRKALAEWIEENATIDEQKQVLSSLAKLKTGEAWIWAPYFNLFKQSQVRPRRTFDSSAAPKAGAPNRAPKDLTKVDLEKLKGKLSETIEKSKAEDPRELRKQNGELRRQVEAMTQERERTGNMTALTDVDRSRIEKLIAAVREAASLMHDDLVLSHQRLQHELKLAGADYADEVEKRAAKAVRQLATIFEQVGIQATLKRLAVDTRSGPSGPIARAADTPSVRQTAKTPPPSDGAISGPEQRILDAIGWLNSVGVVEPEQPAVAFLAKYAYGGGAFNNPRGRLNQRGLVEYRPGERIVLTPDGRRYAQEADLDQTLGSLHGRVLQVLPGPERKILQSLLHVYPKALSNDELAVAANYEPGGGAFNNPKGRLRTLGLIEYPQPGFARARDLLFPAGLR